MAYVSLYRKYRSQTFGDLVGQSHVVKTLQSGITSNRIAHSYLFTGPRGTGKTSTARLLAKALCCEAGPIAEPDNTCSICQSITAGACIDVVEMDAASESGVEDIREQIVDAVEYKPMLCRYKVFIIDEVHDLSSKAFDALLKTIEEPPPHIVFILATTEFNRVPPTIRSRCQKFEFHRAGMQDLVGRLNYVLASEGIEAEPAAISAIARMADGGYRDALTLLEQAILTSDGKVELRQVYDQLGLVSEDSIDKILIAISRAEVTKLIDSLASVTAMGRDPRAILESMMYRLSDLTKAAYQVKLDGGDAAMDAALHDTARQIGPERILRIRGSVSEAHKEIRDVSLPRLWLEGELLALASSLNGPTIAPTISRAAPISPPRQAQEATPRAVIEPTERQDSFLERAKTAWSQTRTVLGNQSPAMKAHLSQTSVVAAEEDAVTVEFEREMDLDWIMDKPNRAPAILSALRERLGNGVTISYGAQKKTIAKEETTAIEMPLEREALFQRAKEMFAQEL